MYDIFNLKNRICKAMCHNHIVNNIYLDNIINDIILNNKNLIINNKKDNL